MPSGFPSSLPMGGLHVKMDQSGCSVTQAPGYPVDMQAASPLLMAVMGLLAKKERESEDDKDQKPEKTLRSGSRDLQQDTAASSSHGNQSEQPKTDTSKEQPKKKQKKQKTETKIKRRGKKF